MESPFFANGFGERGDIHHVSKESWTFGKPPEDVVGKFRSNANNGQPRDPMIRVQAPRNAPLLIRTFAAVFVAMIAGSLGAAPRYKASAYYQVPETGFVVNAVSDSGDMTGRTPNANLTSEEAFLWKAGGSLLRLGTLGGSSSEGTAINSNAQVTGSSDTGTDVHAFLYSGGVMQDLGTLGGVGKRDPSRPSLSTYGSHASGISANGQVTGTALTASSEPHAFLYGGGTMKDIGVLSGGTSSAGFDVNSNGDVTGQSHLGSGQTHAFLYTKGHMLDLGTLGGTRSQGISINDRGQVAGNSNVAGDMSLHAFLYADGVMRDLGTLGGPTSQAGAINNSGQVVGSSTTGETRGRAFIYTDGRMSDLNAFVDSGLGGAVLHNAVTIGDEGTIFAYGCDAGTCSLYRLELLSPDGGGGCAAFTGMLGPIDPTLPVLLLLGLLWMSGRPASQNSKCSVSGS